MKHPNRRRPEIKSARNIMGRNKAGERHVHQFQIACLELERTRRLKELGIASKRVSEINARLVEIEKEMTAHLAAMPKLPPIIPPTELEQNLPAPVVKKAPGHRESPTQEAPRTEGKRRTLRY